MPPWLPIGVDDEQSGLDRNGLGVCFGTGDALPDVIGCQEVVSI